MVVEVLTFEILDAYLKCISVCLFKMYQGMLIYNYIITEKKMRF